jgi:type VI protein secretion system component Hcp
MIMVKIAGFEGTGDATVKGYDDGNWFVADSFSFGVERELRESGEKGGTEDINIGVGELQLVRITKSLDRASPKLAQFAVNGNTPGAAEIHFLSTQGKSGQPYLAYKLDRCFVKSWSTSGDADDRPTEEVAFYYNRIAFQYGVVDPFSWDLVANRVWPGHGLQPLPEPKR